MNNININKTEFLYVQKCFSYWTVLSTVMHQSYIPCHFCQLLWERLICDHVLCHLTNVTLTNLDLCITNNSHYLLTYLLTHYHIVYTRHVTVLLLHTVLNFNWSKSVVIMCAIFMLSTRHYVFRFSHCPVRPSVCLFIPPVRYCYRDILWMAWTILDKTDWHQIFHSPQWWQDYIVKFKNKRSRSHEAVEIKYCKHHTVYFVHCLLILPTKHHIAYYWNTRAISTKLTGITNSPDSSPDYILEVKIQKSRSHMVQCHIWFK